MGGAVKYKVLKIERDEAVARAVEAERLSNIEVVRDLEERLARADGERDTLKRELYALRHVVRVVRSEARTLTAMLDQTRTEES